jgi:hypothetical protein
MLKIATVKCEDEKRILRSRMKPARLECAILLDLEKCNM